MEPKYLIITADDYGMCKSVNRAIEECISAGLVTSTNIMTNMKEAPDAVHLREKFPEVSVGIHFTLTAGKSILSAEQIPTLTDQSGFFYPHSLFRERYKAKQIRKDDIVRELNAQYSAFGGLCGEADYWNTHQNIHVAFSLFELFSKAASEMGIRKMRSHQRIFVHPSVSKEMPFKQRLMEPAKSIVIDRWQKRLNREGIRSPQGLIVIRNERDKRDLAYVLSHIGWNERSCGELVIHPADTDDCVHFGKITGRRIEEYRQFSDEKTKRLLTENGISLIGFDRLA